MAMVAAARTAALTIISLPFHARLARPLCSALSFHRASPLLRPLKGRRRSVQAVPYHTNEMVTGRIKAVLAAEVGLTKPSAAVLPEIAVQPTEVDVAEWKGDILVVGVFEGSLTRDEQGGFEDPQLKKLDGLVGGILGDIITEEDFSGKVGQTTFARIVGYGFKRVGLVGLGKFEAAGSSTKAWKGLGESVATTAKTVQATSIGIGISGFNELTGDRKLAAVSAIIGGVVLGSYEDTRFKSESKQLSLKNLELIGLRMGAELEGHVTQMVQQCSGVILARQLVNAPPNVLIPSVLADEAENIALAHGDVITAKILDKEECEELKMGAYLGVAAASTNPPKFIHLRYTPSSGNVKTKLAIVGKGLTFDSGGYNLKTGPGSMIELMKFDMGGAAAVLGAAKAIAAIKPPAVEVNNTDAEGRLTLADALVYAGNLKVDKIVDLATLTGACIIALGNDIGGMFTPSDELAEELSAASKKAGEKLWRMPMEEGYWEMMKSGIADMVNTGGRAGGSITASLFLKQFVDEKLPWAHLDIAGPVWKDKAGATGFAVPTLVEWVVKHSSS